jgi:putative ABC transport system permease protein
MSGLAVAVRGLRKGPVFTSVAVLSLGIAIGANAAIFSLVDAVLLRPLAAISRPSRLVSLYDVNAHEPARFSALCWPEFAYYRRAAQSFSGMLAYLRVQVRGEGGNVPSELVSDDYFHVLGIQPLAGRDFHPDEAEPVAMISEKFGGPEKLGSILRMEGVPFVVIGIVPASYRGIVLDWGERPQIWIPIKFYAEAVPEFRGLDILHAPSMRSFVVTGRLKPGVGEARAAGEIAALAKNIPLSGDGWSARAMPLGDARFWPGARPAIVQLLSVLLVVGAGILLIACANVVGLMLSRAAQQHRDTAIRFALGARMGDVARLLLTESVLLAMGGTVTGLAIGIVLTRALAAFPKLFSIPLALDFGLDVRVLTFLAVVGALVSVLTGLTPLRQVLRTDLIQSLRASGQVAGSRWRRWNMRTVLTGVQIAISLVLLVEAGLFLRTLRNAAEADPFLRTADLTIYRVDSPSGEEKAREISRLLPEGVQEIPGVRAAVLASVLPMSGMRSAEHVLVDGSKVHVALSTAINAVSPGFFTLAGVVQRRGRDFNTGDVYGRPRVAIVNDSMASKYWDGDTIGRQLRVGAETVSVIGIVPDVTRRSYREEVEPMVYFPVAQQRGGDLFLIVQGHAALPRLQAVLAKVDASAFLNKPQTLAEYMDVVLSQERLAAWCLTALASIAMVLSMVGLYGVSAYSVAQRTAEVGIRMALGSTRGRVLGVVLQPAGLAAGVGVVGGLVLSWGAIRLSAALFYGVSGGDPLTWSVAALTLVGTVVISTAIPAMRVARIDPAEALRAE